MEETEIHISETDKEQRIKDNKTQFEQLQNVTSFESRNEELFDLLFEMTDKTFTESEMQDIIDVVERNSEYKSKYDKCINTIKRFDAGIIGMYDL